VQSLESSKEERVMALESLELKDDTFEYEVWSVERMRLGGYVNVGGVTSSGKAMFGSQDIGTNNQPTLSINVTLTPALQFIHFSNMLNDSPLHWIEVSSYESPPLTDEEITDISRSREEIRTGRSKTFDNARDAIEWLHVQRASRTE